MLGACSAAGTSELLLGVLSAVAMLLPENTVFAHSSSVVAQCKCVLSPSMVVHCEYPKFVSSLVQFVSISACTKLRSGGKRAGPLLSLATPN